LTIERSPPIGQFYKHGRATLLINAFYLNAQCRSDVSVIK